MSEIKREMKKSTGDKVKESLAQVWIVRTARAQSCGQLQEQAAKGPPDKGWRGVLKKHHSALITRHASPGSA